VIVYTAHLVCGAYERFAKGNTPNQAADAAVAAMPPYANMDAAVARLNLWRSTPAVNAVAFSGTLQSWREAADLVESARVSAEAIVESTGMTFEHALEETLACYCEDHMDLAHEQLANVAYAVLTGQGAE
jgi:hypothetical protein